jgi:molybdopterin-guanine dinucleotide biosynthesis protein A
VKNISGVILAGGAGKRFGGKTKSNMTVGGISIITRMVNTLSEVFKEIIVVTNKPEEFQDISKIRIVRDEYKKVGPLGGIHAAMTVSSNPSIFVFGGDMPFISSEIIVRQIEDFRRSPCDVLIPRLKAYDEPLHAIYSLSTFIKLDYYLLTSKEYAIKDFLCKVDVRYLYLDEMAAHQRIFTNINTPLDLSAAETFLQQDNRQNL